MSGKTDEMKGRLEKAAGDLLDDNDLKRKGKTDEAAGKLKQGAERVIDRLKKAAK